MLLVKARNEPTNTNFSSFSGSRVTGVGKGRGRVLSRLYAAHFKPLCISSLPTNHTLAPRSLSAPDNSGESLCGFCNFGYRIKMHDEPGTNVREKDIIPFLFTIILYFIDNTYVVLNLAGVS